MKLALDYDLRITYYAISITERNTAMNHTSSENIVIGFVFCGLALMLTAFAAFITHLWWIITYALPNLSTISAGEAIICFAGLFPPLGAIHGFVIWFT